jgi:hypothetical protein
MRPGERHRLLPPPHHPSPAPLIPSIHLYNIPKSGSHPTGNMRIWGMRAESSHGEGEVKSGFDGVSGPVCILTGTAPIGLSRNDDREPVSSAVRARHSRLNFLPRTKAPK